MSSSRRRKPFFKYKDKYKHSPTCNCHSLFYGLPQVTTKKATTNKTNKLAQLLFSLGAEVYFFDDWVMCINGIEVTYGYGGHIYSVDGVDCKIRYGKPMTEMFAKKLLKKVNAATYSTVYSSKIRWTCDTISWD